MWTQCLVVYLSCLSIYWPCICTLSTAISIPYAWIMNNESGEWITLWCFRVISLLQIQQHELFDNGHCELYLHVFFSNQRCSLETFRKQLYFYDVFRDWLSDIDWVRSRSHKMTACQIQDSLVSFLSSGANEEKIASRRWSI